MARIFIILVFLASSAEGQDFMGKKIIDLTYSFNEQTIYWPTAKSFQHEKVAWGKGSAGFWYTSANICASEHGGTHLDAPIHFAQDKWTNDQIPVERLVGPVLVIDITEACKSNPDYQLQVEDIRRWEENNGPISPDSIVLIRTGWGKFWPDKKNYLGNDKPGDATDLHFPGFSKAAAEFLVKERSIKGAGLDTASLDPGTSQDFIAHQVFNGANVYGLENVANLDRLPAKGALLIALPMKIENGTGGPVRIIALVD
ncbi:MAG TPA: cyclase family protein [Acidobacteriota bacterium]|nr:cyclase family protein [Acidobacteriota bacterium]